MLRPRRPRIPSAPAPFDPPQPRRLRVGHLDVLHLERRDLPLVHVDLVLASGSGHDAPDSPGVAFATAALLDEGAGRRSALEISGELQDLGTSLSTAVDLESTSLSLDVLRSNLDGALAILADVVLRPHLAQSELERIQAEMAARSLERRASPSQVAQLALWAAVYGRHPFARPALPLPGGRAVRRRDVVRFHRERYRSSGAFLVVAGDVGRDELEALVGPLFGSWRPDIVAGWAPARPPPRGPRLVLVEREGADESVLRVGQILPGRSSVGRGSARAEVQLLNTILGGSFTSRLNRNLRERHGYTYGAHSSFVLLRRHGLFVVGAQVESRVTARALGQILIELEAIGRRPVSRAELDKARSLALEEIPEGMETLRGLADAFVDLEFYGEPLGALRRQPLALARVTPDGLLRTARRLVRPDEATLVCVGDVARLRAELERSFGPAEDRDLDGVALRRGPC